MLSASHAKGSRGLAQSRRIGPVSSWVWQSRWHFGALNCDKSQPFVVRAEGYERAFPLTGAVTPCMHVFLLGLLKALFLGHILNRILKVSAAVSAAGVVTCVRGAVMLVRGGMTC